VEEIKRILEMVAEGKITADEGTRLIQALETAEKSSTTPGRTGKGKFIRIKVNSGDGDVVNVNIPLALARVAMRFVPKEARAELADKDINLDEVIEAIMSGAEGSIVDIKSGDGDIVQIYVD
jgi:nitrogen regulatory protein PII